MAKQRTAVVAGASGIVGYRLAQSLAASSEWKVLGIARSAPRAAARFDVLNVDLTNVDDCRAKLAPLRGVTHLFYAAKYNTSNHFSAPEGDAVDVNVAMLTNVLAALDRRGAALRHVHLVHGNSYYGEGDYRKTPSKESDPRWVRRHFYYLQQDLVSEYQKGKRWSWSISRPQGICDPAPHIARSIPLGIAVYATLSKALGLPLSFPGCEENYTAIQQVTDASHLARAITWMATEERCANQAFNVTNGSYFRWQHLWPVLANFFGMPVGPLRRTKLAKAMAGQAQRWDALMNSSRGKNRDYEKLVLWPYLDRVFAARSDQMSDVTKLHRFGFHEIVDTEEMFQRFFASYRRARLIP
jgi:nucleoside-diphosphate-sugar epimerase